METTRKPDKIIWPSPLSPSLIRDVPGETMTPHYYCCHAVIRMTRHLSITCATCNICADWLLLFRQLFEFTHDTLPSL
jgi:hypothetical protein